MPCTPHELRNVPLFSLLDDDEICVLAAQVEIRTFAARQRIYKLGDPGDRAYILLSGTVHVSTIDEDQQEVILDQPRLGEFFGFASMLEQTPHHTSAVAIAETVCVEVDRHDITVLIETKPLAGLDMMSVLARQFHASQDLIRLRAARNPNQIIEEEETFGERVADKVASFGGSWTFIILFGFVLASIQAPVIMMSQNRQDKKDRLRSEIGFDVNVRAEAEIRSLSRHLKALHDKLDDVDQLVRSKPPQP
jgi:CRP/FNR family cyclic AMP-dependent transcriptional regulator